MAAATGRTEIGADLTAAGLNVRRAAELLAELFRTWPDDTRELRAEISACEHRGDELTHAILKTLHRTKLARYDRGDLHRLAGAIDDVVDDIEEAAEETSIYRIEAPLEQAEELAAVLRDTGRDLAAALEHMDELDAIGSDLISVRRREQEGDRIYRNALAALFDGGIDPILIIRWKDVLERIESAIDSCRRAADVLQSIALKQS